MYSYQLSLLRSASLARTCRSLEFDTEGFGQDSEVSDITSKTSTPKLSALNVPTFFAGPTYFNPYLEPTHAHLFHKSLLSHSFLPARKSHDLVVICCFLWCISVFLPGQRAGFISFCLSCSYKNSLFCGFNVSHGTPPINGLFLILWNITCYIYARHGRLM